MSLGNNNHRYVVDAPVLVNRNPIFRLPGVGSLTWRQCGEWVLLAIFVFFLIQIVKPDFGGVIAMVIGWAFLGYILVQQDYNGITGTDIAFRRIRFYVVNWGRHRAISSGTEEYVVIPKLNIVNGVLFSEMITDETTNGSGGADRQETEELDAFDNTTREAGF
jgi:hypothetical protein